MRVRSPGLNAIAQTYPKVRIVVSEVDAGLNSAFHIVPGIGTQQTAPGVLEGRGWARTIELTRAHVLPDPPAFSRPTPGNFGDRFYGT